MLTLLFDGSYEGLLCALDEAQHSAGTIELAAEADWQPALLDDAHHVATDPARARRFLEALTARVGQPVVQAINYCFLAEKPAPIRALAAYCRMAFARGPAVIKYHAHAAVHTVHMTAQRVGGELHRYKGLTRFRELRDGTLWAPLQPEYNILAPLALHFARRIPTPAWVLYDIGRDYGIRWDGTRHAPVTLDRALTARIRAHPAAADEIVSETERRYQALWRSFFKNISVTSRTNLRLQRRHMPQRYWRFLVEKTPAL
jgi:probable DNA metabolism protein